MFFLCVCVNLSWQVRGFVPLSDGVMGGRSEASLVPVREPGGEGSALFCGTLRTAGGGGFASVRGGEGPFARFLQRTRFRFRIGTHSRWRIGAQLHRYGPGGVSFLLLSGSLRFLCS